MQARQEASKRGIGDPVYEPILTEDSSRRTDSAALPPSDEGAREKKRRDRIRALRVFLRILVNGRHLKQPDGLAPLEIQLRPVCKDFDFAMQVATRSSLRALCFVGS